MEEENGEQHQIWRHSEELDIANVGGHVSSTDLLRDPKWSVSQRYSLLVDGVGSEYVEHSFQTEGLHHEPGAVEGYPATIGMAKGQGGSKPADFGIQNGWTGLDG